MVEPVLCKPNDLSGTGAHVVFQNHMGNAIRIRGIPISGKMDVQILADPLDQHLVGRNLAGNVFQLKGRIAFAGLDHNRLRWHSRIDNDGVPCDCTILASCDQFYDFCHVGIPVECASSSASTWTLAVELRSTALLNQLPLVLIHHHGRWALQIGSLSGLARIHAAARLVAIDDVGLEPKFLDFLLGVLGVDLTQSE